MFKVTAALAVPDWCYVHAAHLAEIDTMADEIRGSIHVVDAFAKLRE